MRLLSCLLLLLAAIAVAAVPTLESARAHAAQLRSDAPNVYAALQRRVADLKSTEASSASRKLLADQCADLLDASGNLLSYEDMMPKACSDCGYAALTPQLKCPTTGATTTGLPVGACCNNNTHCASGLVCDRINGVCTTACTTAADCPAGPWETQPACIDTAKETGHAAQCSFCNYTSSCPICTLCPNYIGPVDAALSATAGCGNYTAAVAVITAEDRDVMCSHDCVFDCEIPLAETMAAAWDCLESVCGENTFDEDAVLNDMELLCAAYEGEFCAEWVEQFEDDATCTERQTDSCCWYTLYGEPFGQVCAQYNNETCSPLFSGASSTAPALLAVVASIAAAVFAGVF